LENLPKNKVKVNIEHELIEENTTPQKSQSVFEDFLNQTQEFKTQQRLYRLDKLVVQFNNCVQVTRELAIDNDEMMHLK